MASIFVAGLGTDVGKTYVSYLLCKKLKADYWKPVQCGCLPTDTDFINKSDPSIRTYQESYLLPQPVNPYTASGGSLDFNKILTDYKLISNSSQKDLVIEGSGGLMVPITKDKTFLDFIVEVKIPVLIVINDKLGCINHTYLTASVLRSNNVCIVGAVLNNFDPEQSLGNKHVIETIIDIPILSELSTGADTL